MDDEDTNASACAYVKDPLNLFLLKWGKEKSTANRLDHHGVRHIQPFNFDFIIGQDVCWVEAQVSILHYGIVETDTNLQPGRYA